MSMASANLRSGQPPKQHKLPLLITLNSFAAPFKRNLPQIQKLLLELQISFIRLILWIIKQSGTKNMSQEQQN